MKELVSPQQAEAIVRGVAIGLAAVGLVGGAIAAAVTRRRPAPAAGGLVAVAGALVYALWAVYNAVIASLGLDSVKALFINLGIFVVVGLGYGILAAWAWRRVRA